MSALNDEVWILAQKHYEIEQGVLDIFEIKAVAGPAAYRDRIRLLEVNENTIPSGVVPIPFDPLPASGIHYPSVIVEVTPEEFAKIQNSELTLPFGWEVGGHIPRKQNGGQ
jgi:hypothetical protein